MFAIIDLETTGGYAYRNKIIDIAIYIHDGKKVIDKFTTLINPERPIPPHITTFTGITNDMVVNAPKFYEVAKEIYEITKDKVFVAHNVGFDYSFMKEEYRNLGSRYQRKRLCTVRLSRKIFTDLPFYSLSNLCMWLGIKINNRHTAAGDAEATVKLFEMLLKEDNGGFIQESLKKFSREGILPPNLPKETFDNLPEETGVYYFHNEKGDVIYVGKAKSIKDRIISHFTHTAPDGIKVKRNSRIYDISYELTGNELIALLFESSEIKRLNPVYNRAQKRNYKNYGIYHYYDNNNYLRLSINKVKDIDRTLVSFSSILKARKFLERIVVQYELCPKLCGLQQSSGPCFSYHIHKCKGACKGKERKEKYNGRIKKAIRSFNIKGKSFALIGRGRECNEKSVVLVEKGIFIGYGYFSGEMIIRDPSEFKDYINTYPDNQDIQRILDSHIRKNTKDVMINYSA